MSEPPLQSNHRIVLFNLPLVVDLILIPFFGIHIAESIKLIFSCSKRNLLKSMFNDRNKPLYRLCEEIALERIGEADYKGFVNNFAKEKWGTVLTESDFEMLMSCTGRHPYYFNALLRGFFAQGKNKELTSKDFLGEVKLAGSSVVRGLEDLMEEDFI